MSATSEHGSGFEELSFRKLFETSAVGFWRIDRAGKTLYLNPAMCAMLEIASRDDIGEATYHRFFMQESLDRMAVEHAKRTGGVTSTYEVELIGAQGTRRHVMISGAPDHDASGALVGLIGTFTDVSAVHRAERARSESESRLRSLFEASVDAIGVSCRGTHVMVNPAYLRMFGYAHEDELSGRSILDLIAPSEHARVMGFVQRRAQGVEMIQHYVTRGKRRGGDEFPLEVHVSSYKANDVYTVVILRDITERLQLEAQLRESQKMDALGRLSGGVAHDFNNLLSVIMACAELILKDPTRVESTVRNADMIRATGGRGAALTHQLLALSRGQVIEPKPVDVDALVTETAEMLRRLIGPRITLQLELGAKLPAVLADAGQLQQVLINLCVNARDAIADVGRIAITVTAVELCAHDLRTMRGLSPGRYVELKVSDDGVGMDVATQSRIFEPFFTTKGPERGTGLGLSTVYGIVQQSGGHVGVTSALGQGSVFTIHLPAMRSPSIPAPVRDVVSTRPRESSATVLIVEDELSVREVVQRFLEGEGYRVITAADGTDALRALERIGGRVDLVITDMLMPGMGGAELANMLDRTTPTLPIVFMSGYSSDDAPHVLASRPRSAFLAKPFALADMSEQIQRLLAR